MFHGRFHGVLPKEYLGTFYEVSWELLKEMFTNTHRFVFVLLSAVLLNDIMLSIVMSNIEVLSGHKNTLACGVNYGRKRFII